MLFKIKTAIINLAMLINTKQIVSQNPKIDTMKTFNSKTIVFIHGLFMNPTSWEPWIKYFEAKGYKCYAPAYPFHEGKPQELRNNINPALGKLTFSQVIDSLSVFIDKLPEKPILIGHSMGGLAVQKLIELNKGVAGICIDAAPPKGV